jgi:hypothetical protein
MGGTRTVLGFSGGVVARGFEKSSPMVVAGLREQCYCYTAALDCACKYVSCASGRGCKWFHMKDSNQIHGIVVASACFDMWVESIHRVMGSAWTLIIETCKRSVSMLLVLVVRCPFAATEDLIEKYIMNMASPSPSPSLPVLQSGNTDRKLLKNAL